MTIVSDHYRPEIDGLRALAVLLILMFHAGFDWASGGYIGVDVFFVISGFLITRNIQRELKQGSFSFSLFYIRRIKRLFPALFAALIITLASAFFIFSPADLERLGQSLQFAVLSISNFFFWQESGYFNHSSEIKPLLHTWSLAVEEQFYLIWPAIIFAMYSLNKRRALLTFLCIAFVVSLVINSIYLNDYASTVFFHLPFRVFEFALGALCVYYPNKKLNHSAIKNLLGLIGVLLIATCAVSFDQATLFPGFNALIPCIGAAMIIVSGQSFIGQHLLSHKIAIKIGLISYSVYLIHWPLMVFYKYWKFTDIELSEKIGLIIASLMFGFLMWKFIERPFRFKTEPTSTIKFYLKTLVLAGFIFSLGYVTQYKKGWPERYPQEFFLSAEERLKNRDRYWKEITEIIKNKTDGYKNIIVLGNSHAIDLIYALIENDSKLNFTFFNSWFRCFNFGTAIQRQDNKICDKKRIRYFNNPAWANTEAIYLHDNWSVLDLDDLNSRLQEVRNLSQAPITIFGPKMTYTKRIPSIVQSHMRMSTINQYSQQFSELEYLNRVNTAVKKMIESTKIANVNYIDLLTLQCGNKGTACKVVSDKNHEFLYFDRDHFTLLGAKEFGAKLKIKYPSLFQ